MADRGMQQALGKYRLIAELGRGGMGQVFLAVTSGMSGAFSKLVVVKKLHGYLTSDPEFGKMFLDEARIAARLNHPNVVQTYECGVEDNVLFLVMEYLDGQPLHRILSRAGDDFPLEMHLAVLTDVLAGLHHAHALADFDGKPLDIVHRDVSPHNVFVTYDGQIKVVDFGIAHARGRSTKTAVGLVKGKPAYMAPEQARGEATDARADVFAVGVMLFEALTDRSYWGDRSIEAIRRALLAGELPTLPDDAADPELVALCRKALAIDVDQRFASALHMQRALEAYAAAKLARPTSLQIGAEVEELFRDRRKAVKQVIESQVARLKARGELDAKALPVVEPNEPRASVPDATPTRVDARTARAEIPNSPALEAFLPTQLAVTPPASNKPTPVSARIGAAPNAPPSARAAPSTPKQPRSSKVLAIGASAIVIAGTVAWLLPRSSPAPAPITIELRANAPNTRFRIDDGPWLGNPFRGSAPRDGLEHTIVADTGDGAPDRTTVRFDGDVVWLRR